MDFFNSNENKGILWDLLISNGLFENIDTNYYKHVRDEFNLGIQDVNQQKNNIQYVSNENVIELNKFFINLMIKRLDKFKKPNYTSDHLQQERLNEFSQSLNEKQEEFDKMTKPNIPDNIDLSDNIKEESINDMELLIKQKEKERESINIPIDNTELLLKEILKNQKDIITILEQNKLYK